MLESLGQTNIGGLNLEESGLTKNNALFELENDLTEKDWEEMLGKFEDNGNLISRSENNFQQHLFTGIALKLLSFERFKQIHLPGNLLKLSGEIISKKRSMMENLLGSFTGGFLDTEMRDSVGMMAHLSILYPKKRAEIRRSCRSFVEPCLNDLAVGAPYIYEFAFDLSVLFPTEILPEVRALGAEPYREHFVDIAGAGRDFFSWSHSGLFSMIWPKATYKILFPDEAPLASKDDWSEMKKNLIRSRGNVNLWDPMADLALCMKILAAERANITEYGDIEIIMPEPKQSLTEEIPALPETRKF